MSGDQGAVDPGAEREIDLRGWWNAFRARWWIAAVGLAIGLVVGALYSLSGGSSYTASAIIAPGQAFNPAGSEAVLTYLTSEAALNTLANATATLDEAAAKAHLSPGELRGHVTVSSVNLSGNLTPNQSGNNHAVLVNVTVTSPKAKHAEDAANAIAQVVRDKTTSNYVKQSIAAYQTLIANFKKREGTLNTKIAALNAALRGKTAQSLSPLDKLVLDTDLDTAEGTLGATLNSITTTQQQLTLAQTIETTQIVQEAKASKTVARSRRNAVLFGALIGLLVGAIVAIVAGLRATRAVRAAQTAAA
jgi:uncharacterized protein involved in exopolysaccharide biosynthesis